MCAPGGACVRVCGELGGGEEEERSTEAELFLSEEAVAELEALLSHYETGKLNLYATN